MDQAMTVDSKDRAVIVRESEGWRDIC
jgi:hypothetical protein